jgi:hypothetical protein
MPDNLKNVGRPDRDRINTSEDHEIQYWTKELGVSSQQLKEAVKTVGPVADDVRAHLRGRK